jgi:hypothetical protein
MRCCSCDERFYVNLYWAWKLGFAGKATDKRQQEKKKVGGGSAVA